MDGDRTGCRIGREPCADAGPARRFCGVHAANLCQSLGVGADGEVVVGTGIASSLHMSHMRTANWKMLAGWSGAMSVSLVIGLVLGGAGSSQRADAAEAPRRHLPSPEHIESATLTQLRERMGRHGNTVSNLVRAVVLLDRPTVRTLAGNIADEEIAAGTWASINTWATIKGNKRLPLPNEFYEQQDALRVSARELAAAALPGGDDNALADRFATLTRTCVACHSVYLHGGLQPQTSTEQASPDPSRKP